jgi:dihydrodipicolinate synthase/N-acetylneuraminate lyase
MNAHPYGCDGYLSSFLSFHPATAHRYWQAIETGDLSAAQTVIRDIDMPFFDYIMGVEGGFDAAIHGILELIGVAGRWRPPPYHSLTDSQMEELDDFLRGLGVL